MVGHTRWDWRLGHWRCPVSRGCNREQRLRPGCHHMRDGCWEGDGWRQLPVSCLSGRPGADRKELLRCWRRHASKWCRTCNSSSIIPILMHLRDCAASKMVTTACLSSLMPVSVCIAPKSTRLITHPTVLQLRSRTFSRTRKQMPCTNI